MPRVSFGAHSLVVVLGGALGLVPAGAAEACECGPRAWTVPGDGATLVPTDIQPLLVIELPLVERRVTLTGGGVSKAAELEVLGSIRGTRTVRVVPSRPLEPATRYRLMLGDPDEPVIALGFTTGAGPVAAPPDAPSVLGFDPRRAELIEPGTCGGAVFELGLELGDVDATAAYQVRIEGDGVDDTLVVRGDELAELGGLSGGCGFPVPLLYDARHVCVELRALDQAGRAGSPVVACSDLPACQPVACSTCDDFQCVAWPDEPIVVEGGCAAGGPGAGWAGVVVALAGLAVTRRRWRASADAGAGRRRRAGSWPCDRSARRA